MAKYIFCQAYDRGVGLHLRIVTANYFANYSDKICSHFAISISEMHVEQTLPELVSKGTLFEK